MDTPDDDEIRDVLLEYSDHQAVRNVFGAHTRDGDASLVDYVEAMRATGGTLAVVANDGAAEVYARWDGTKGRYEYLTILAPWSIGGYDYADAETLVGYLDDLDDTRPTLQKYTPFADPDILASLAEGIWP